LDQASAPTRTSFRAPEGGSIRALGDTPPDPALGHFLPGAMLAGRYRIVGLLGRGGMGEVYRADDLKLGRPVALKFLPRELETDRGRLDRFLNEARVALAVTHPNVCRVYDIGDLDGRHYISMEYIDGEDLASLLRRIGRLPEDKALEIARQLCAGLAAAHEEGILHRDLKPANVMIDGRGRAKITDFGLAGLAAGIGGAEIAAGTPGYMAPEQISGESVSVRSDVYALGLVLYELFTGRAAFRADSIAELRKMQTEATPSSPSAHLAVLDPVIEQVVLRCLHKRPDRRPASALAVSAALPGGDPLAAALAAGETPSPELVAEAGRREALRPAVGILLALAGLALFVGATRWAATLSMMHFLPLDKRPEVLIDRVQSVLASVGYDEPAYSEPVDQAWGFFTWGSVFGEVAEADDSARRWEGLRSRPDAMAFWYRQSTRTIYPSPTGGAPVFTRHLVRVGNPPPTAPGDVVVIFDLAGRLRRLEVAPKRFSTRDAGEPDWAPLFTLAGLDPARFMEDRPRYQRFHTPDHRRAWTGSREELPGVEYRVEAGSYEGRPTLFNVAAVAGYEEMAADPEPHPLSVGASVVNSVEPILLLILTGLSIPLARRHLKQGRADRRGAVRWALAISVLYVATAALNSHVLFTRDGLGEIWTLIVGGVFFFCMGWLFYVAAEPIGRRVWPTMFVSWNRLFSRPRVEWRDPLIGQSVLIGLVFGAIIFMINSPLRWSISTWREGAPWWLNGYDLDLLVGQRVALAQLMEAPLAGSRWFLLVAALVVLRLVTKRAWPAVLLAVILWPLMIGTTTVEGMIYSVAGAAISMVVLLRWGIVALILTNLFASVAWIARTSDWSAWHATPALTTLVLVVALVAYGVWAASGGRSPAFEHS
jgi:serine/threonine-protein kinase